MQYHKLKNCPSNKVTEASTTTITTNTTTADNFEEIGNALLSRDCQILQYATRETSTKTFSNPETELLPLMKKALTEYFKSLDTSRFYPELLRTLLEMSESHQQEIFRNCTVGRTQLACHQIFRIVPAGSGRFPLITSPTFATGMCFSLNPSMDNLFSKSSLGNLVSQLEGNVTDKVSLPSGKSRRLKLNLNLDVGQEDSDISDQFDIIIGSAGSYLSRDKTLKLELGLEHWLDLTAQATFSGHFSHIHHLQSFLFLDTQVSLAPTHVRVSVHR